MPLASLQTITYAASLIVGFVGLCLLAGAVHAFYGHNHEDDPE